MDAQRQEQLIEMVSQFSDEYLDEEYKTLCIKLANKLMDNENISINRGKTENWACAIIYTIGQLNFLFEYPTRPYVDPDSLCAYFKSKRQTIVLKARDVRRALNLKLGDEEFSTEFVLSLNIPESDDDLKRIRQLDEIKFLISKKAPKDIGDLDNNELLELIRYNSRDEKLYFLLRQSYFICFYS